MLNLMKPKRIWLVVIGIGLNNCLIYADGLTNNSTNPIVNMGGYSMMRGTNGHWIFVNPSEFWNGIWKEDTNGWRVQLRVRPLIYSMFQEGVGYTLTTNLMLRVEWGSVVKNSGSGYYLPPNGKFVKLELQDAKGNIVQPNPDAGTNLLLRNLKGGFTSLGGMSRKLPTYGTLLPAWADPSSGSLVAIFPKTISTNVYPYFENNMLGEIPGVESVTNFPPLGINALKLDEVYSITNEGDYTLTVQPVLYKKRIETNLLDRVDLPSVSTKIHLMPSR
jgi:hypothetical protein